MAQFARIDLQIRARIVSDPEESLLGHFNCFGLPGASGGATDHNPNSKFWGWISDGRPRGHSGRRPGAKTSVRPSKSRKIKLFHTVVSPLIIEDSGAVSPRKLVWKCRFLH